MITRAVRCPNFNHGRANAPVRFCPQCGGVVNDKIALRRCSNEQHAERRRHRDAVCVDCGTQLQVS